MSTRYRPQRGFTLIEIMIVIAIIAILAAVLIPNFRKARATSQFNVCKSNVKTLGTSFEMYANDSGGRLPLAKENVVPNYLRAIPRCPNAPTATSTNYNYVAVSSPDAYTVFCMGTQHREAGSNTLDYPQYTSQSGLVTSP